MSRALIRSTALLASLVLLASSYARADGPDAAKELEHAVLLEYAHRDQRHVDWPARFSRYDARLRGATSPDAFADIAAELLSAAEDPHIGIEVAGKVRGTFRPNGSPDFDKRLIAPLVPDVTSDHRCVSFGHAEPGIGYVLIGEWSESCGLSAERALSALQNERALIIDVRPNGGGNELVARHIAGHFLSSPSKYAWVETIADGRFSPREAHVVAPVAPRFSGSVVVLSGPRAMSSNESFLLMMRTAGATLVGARSYGSSGNPLPHRLTNGVTVTLPSWREYAVDGTPIEGRGVLPDVTVAWPMSATEDVILKAAIARLQPAAPK